MEEVAVLPVLFDSSASVVAQARLTVGEKNYYNINPSVPLDKLRPGYGGGMMYPILVRCGIWELAEKTVARLLQKDYFLGTINESLQVMRHYPEDVAKFITVLALDRDSWWQSPSRDMFFPWVAVKEELRGVGRWRARAAIHPNDGVIVFRNIAHRFAKPLRI